MLKYLSLNQTSAGYSLLDFIFSLKKCCVCVLLYLIFNLFVYSDVLLKFCKLIILGYRLHIKINVYIIFVKILCS